MAYLSFKKTLRAMKCCLPAAAKSKLFHTPSWVHFYLTRRCNLSCKYCHVKDNTKKDISTDEVKKIIDRLYYLGIRTIAFFGGEPTLRKDFCEILNYSVKKGIFTYFTTNGTLLNEEYIKNIAETGVDFIELSVDSINVFEDSRKDYTRNKGVIDLLLKYKKLYDFALKTHIVLTNKNVDSVVETIKSINNRYDIPLTVGYICRSVDKDFKDDESLFFNSKKSKEKLSKVIDEIIELKRKGAKIISPYSYFESMKKFAFNEHSWACMAGKYSFSVDYNGLVQLCSAMKPYAVSVFEMDKDFFKNRWDEIEMTKKECTKVCFSTCHNTTAQIIDNPIKYLFGK